MLETNLFVHWTERCCSRYSRISLVLLGNYFFVWDQRYVISWFFFKKPFWEKNLTTIFTKIHVANVQLQIASTLLYMGLISEWLEITCLGTNSRWGLMSVESSLTLLSHIFYAPSALIVIHLSPSTQMDILCSENFQSWQQGNYG